MGYVQSCRSRSVKQRGCLETRAIQDRPYSVQGRQALVWAAKGLQLTSRKRLRTYPSPAPVAELVDALVSGTSAARREGSSPFLGTKIPPHDPEKWAPVFGKDHAQASRVSE